MMLYLLLAIGSGCDRYFHGSDRLIILAYFLEAPTHI